MDLNPLLGTASTVVAVDARIRLEKPAEVDYFLDHHYMGQSRDV